MQDKLTAANRAAREGWLLPSPALKCCWRLSGASGGRNHSGGRITLSGLLFAISNRKRVV
jgi:hypothetical protein